MVILVHTLLVEADTTISGHFLHGRKWRAALRGQTNPANRPIAGKIAKMALFNPCMEFKNFLAK